MDARRVEDDRELYPIFELLTTPALYDGAGSFWNSVEYKKDDFSGMIISRKQINEQLLRLSRELHQMYSGKNPHFVWVADGAYPFFRDFKMFYDSLNGESYTESMARVKSYSGLSSTGKIRKLDADFSLVNDRHVVLFEDIIDTGNSMHQVLQQLRQHDPLDVKVVSLLDKRIEKTYAIKADFTLFSIPDAFVVGYGLDYNNYCRDLDNIYVLSRSGKDRLDSLVRKA